MLRIKGALGTLLSPFPCALLLVVVGLLVRGRGRRRLGGVLIWSGAGVLIAASLGPVSSALLRPLEGRYPAVLDAALLQPQPRYIAVLGSGYRARAGWPVTTALGSDAMIRLSEGVRLFRQLPGSLLIVSGGSMGDDPPSARGYLIAAQTLGVPQTSIIVNDKPLDTMQEIRAIQARVGTSPVVLVTEAFHMPRAMADCARLGVQAIPAPTGNLADPVSNWTAGVLVPSGLSLHKTELALHEYVGLLALNLGIE